MLKKLIKKTLAGAGIALLLAGMLPAVPAAAADAAWAEEVIPNTQQYVLAPAGMDILDIAVYGSSTFYAAPGSSVTETVIYKSTDSGGRWQAVSVPFQADMVAVSPSNAAIVAIAETATGQVALSTDGGETWYDLEVPQQTGGEAATAVYDLDVSPVYEGRYYIAAAGTESGGKANVWYYDTGAAAAAWKEANNGAGFIPGEQAAAVHFSPGFSADKTLLALTEEDGEAVRLQAFKVSSGEWNSSGGLSSYPVTITAGGGITTLDAASIATGPGFVSSSAGNRIIFIGLAMSGSGGIYRIKQEGLNAIKTGTGIRSVAYDGTRLAAGAYASNTVYRSTEPLVTTPAFSNPLNGKYPGGTGKVVLAWAGSNIAAGTSGAQSAIAVSKDYGSTFNDISLIDTTIDTIGDIAVSQNGKTVYMVSADGSHLSLWRRTTGQNDAISWARVYNRPGDADYILRTNPDNATALYLAEKDSRIIYVNPSGGNAGWQTRSGKVNARDIAVVDANSLYVLAADGSVAESHDAAFSWTSAQPTGLNSGASIYSFDAANLVVGSQDGYVAYSTDGNASWTMIPDIVETGAGEVQVITSPRFEENRYIYAASDTPGGNIMRWNAATGNEWGDISPDNIAGGIYGLAMYDGILYALEYDAATQQSALWRHLAPDNAKSNDDAWSRSVTTATTDETDASVRFDIKPRALWASEDKVWTVKTNGTNKLYSFRDITVIIKASNPAPGAVIKVNPISGDAVSAAFSWSRPADVVTAYELQIANDRDFFIPVVTATVNSQRDVVSVTIGPNQTGANHYDFFTGSTYYWRVRVIQPVYSAYSEPRSFSVTPVAALHVAEILTPANGATTTRDKPSFSWSPISGVESYQFVLGPEADLAAPLIDVIIDQPALTSEVALTPGTYFWQVRSADNENTIWSALANFTVEEADEAGAPMIIINGPGEVAPPPIIQTPTTVPPADYVPEPAGADSMMRFIIYFGIALALILLIIIFRTTGPFRLPAGFGNRLRGLGGGLLNGLGNLDPRRLRLPGRGLPAPAAPAAFAASAEASPAPAAAAAAETAHSHAHAAVKPQDTPAVTPEPAKTPAIAAAKQPEPPAPPTHDEAMDAAESGRAVAFAVESFLWMTQEEKSDGQMMLTSDEIINTGRSLAAKIKALAARTILHVSFPNDAAIFLRLWSLYGSREETSRYLTDTFKARPESVTALLRCYLPADAGAEAEFGRAQYDAVSESVDPGEVYKVLTGIYGSQLNSLGDTDASPERTIAARFARIHLALKPEAASEAASQTGLYNA